MKIWDREQPDIEEPTIGVGTKICVHHSDGSFDMGRIVSIEDGWAEVDMLDSMHKWLVEDLRWRFVDGYFACIPLSDGVETERFT